MIDGKAAESALSPEEDTTAPTPNGNACSPGTRSLAHRIQKRLLLLAEAGPRLYDDNQMKTNDSHDHVPETDAAEPRPWQTLSSQYLFDRPWLKVRQDHVRLPRGHELPDYYVVEHPPWVNVVAETTDDRLVLIRQYRHGLAEVHFELPGGVADAEDESLVKAAQRELMEETGFGGGDWREWMVLSANPARQNNRNYTFLARGVQRLERPTLDAGEDIAVQLVTKQAAREIVLSGGMIHALHVGPLLKYFLEGR